MIDGLTSIQRNIQLNIVDGLINGRAVSETANY